MLKRAYTHFVLTAGFGLFLAASAHAQVQPEASGGPVEEEDSQMMTPPLLTGTIYANMSGSDTRRNVLTTAVSVNAAYVDNVLPTDTTTPVADETVSIDPHIQFDRATVRQLITLNYDPAYTFYTPTSVLDNFDQSAGGVFQGRITQNVTLGMQDFFVKTSNVFDESYPFSAGGLPGSTQTPIPAAIAPFAEQLRNVGNANATWQFSRNAMVGGGGLFSEYRFPNQNQSAGLYDSNGEGGSAFYSRRATRRQYIGVNYEYDRTLAYLGNSQIETQAHTLLPFYSVFFTKTFSLSAAAGPVRVDIGQPQQQDILRWAPELVLSMGWQGNRGNVSTSFLRTVTSGGGLVGAYNSVSGNLSGGWKISHTWTAQTSFTYQNIELLAPLAIIIYQGGNSLMAQGSLGRTLGEHVNVQFGYQRFHEQFNGIAAIAANPDGDRGFVNVTYDLKKTLGR
jgi:hypothetical protein